MSKVPLPTPGIRVLGEMHTTSVSDATSAAVVADSYNVVVGHVADSAHVLIYAVKSYLVRTLCTEDMLALDR